MKQFIKRLLKKVCRCLGAVDVIEVVKLSRYEVEHSDCLLGKNILITGGSSGIGLAIAKKCLACGARVLITGRNESKLAKAQCGEPTDRFMTMIWDITNLDDIKTNVDKAIGLLGGRVDVLVNNAGISIREEYGKLTLGVWDKLIRTNLVAPVFITQAMTNKWILEKTGGIVLFVSSMAGEEPAFDAYGASKCALSSMTQGMARTLAPYGIRVNAIAPGVVIGTDLRELQRSIKPDGDLKCPWIPAKRYAVPDEIAEMATFMISEKASYMNGAIIVCDGAGSLRR